MWQKKDLVYHFQKTRFEMTLFNKNELKKLLPRKKPGRKKKEKNVLLWKAAFKILRAGGYICFGKRTNNDEVFLKLCKADGSPVRILHYNTYNALIRKNRILCCIADHRQYYNPHWTKRRVKK